MTPTKLFGRALRRCRRAAGLSQAELAEALGYCTSYIGHFEHGRRLPSQDLVSRIDEHLGSGAMLADLRKQLVAASAVMAVPRARATDGHATTSDLDDPEIRQALDALTEALASLAGLRERPASADGTSADGDRAGDPAAPPASA